MTAPALGTAHRRMCRRGDVERGAPMPEAAAVERNWNELLQELRVHQPGL